MEVHGQAIDLLINNACVGGPRGQTIGNIDYEAWGKVLDANTMGPLRVSETFVDNVARSERKLIVTLTSGMGSIADNTSGSSIAYRSSKAAVNMVMRSLAIDLAPRGITCVVLNPGWVKTDMGGPHAAMTPEESVTKLRRLIDTFGPAQSGKFFNYDGREYPW
jgi:NAD(P)-dependent dehydrogenase (short-subunit alcohol dehydrogenase family)